MGSFAECWLGPLYVGSTKNCVDPALITLFRSSDKHILSGKKENIPYQVRGYMEDYEEGEEMDVVYYSSPVKVIRDRLDLLGYTFETSKFIFNKYIEKEINWVEKQFIRPGKEEENKIWLERINYFRSLEVDNWLASLEEAYTASLKDNNNEKNEDKILTRHKLDSDWYGYPGDDLTAALRLAIEILPIHENYVYDITGLIGGGYFDKEDDLVEDTINAFSSDYNWHGKTIILTEGVTDSWILSESIKLLYPHLADHFTFMDFANARVGGGAGNLVNIVKAFLGAGIINKIIAVFDNDTASESALTALQKVEIPKNIKILQLPPLEFLKNYPTLGPSGETKMDVNGLAGTIELYLGRDVLKDRKGEYFFVKWTGLNPGTGKYQGEILGKDEIQKNFKKKVDKCKEDESLIGKTEWDGLRAIFANIFCIFHESDGENIISFLDESYK